MKSVFYAKNWDGVYNLVLNLSGIGWKFHKCKLLDKKINKYAITMIREKTPEKHIYFSPEHDEFKKKLSLKLNKKKNSWVELHKTYDENKS